MPTKALHSSKNMCQRGEHLGNCCPGRKDKLKFLGLLSSASLKKGEKSFMQIWHLTTSFCRFIVFKHLLQWVINLLRYFQRLISQVPSINNPVREVATTFFASLLTWRAPNYVELGSSPKAIECWLCFPGGHDSWNQAFVQSSFPRAPSCMS